MVNAVTAVMEYAMPLVDDLLTELESYLWFCSLDAASGFWAVLMTRRARWISAFVCALGHFEWLRMPFGLKNAPMIYQRLIDNALYGYVQPKGGWALFAELARRAEEVAADIRATRRDIDLLTNVDSTSPVTKFEADRLALAESDPLQELINSPEANMFLTGEPDESKFVPVFERRSFVDDICFGGRSFDECLETLDRLLKRLAECRISVSFTKSIFVHPKVEFLSHEVTRRGIAANSKKLAAIAEMPFPTSKKGMQAFLGALNYYSRFIQNLAVYGAVLYQLKEDDFAPGGDLTAAKASFAELKKRVVDAPILRHFDSAKDVHVMVFANEWAISCTLMQMHDQKLHPVRFCGRVLKENEMNYHLAEKEVLALLQFLKICYTLLTGKVIHVYTRFSTLEWVFSSKALYGRAVSFAVLLAPHHLKIKRVRERDTEFVQLLQAAITPFTELDESMAHIAPPSKGSASVRLDPELLYAHVPTGFDGFVMSFDGSAKTEKNGGYGSCSWILWRLPTWDIVIAASAHLPRTTVNLAEYTGMNNGVTAAIAKGVNDLIIVGDSRLAVQQSMGVIACKKEALQIELARHKSLTSKLNSVRYLHVVRSYNAAADALATEALEAQAGRVVLSGERKAELKVLNRIAEVLCVDIKKPEETTPTVTAMTRSQTRRVRFADEEQKNSTSEMRGDSARGQNDPNEPNDLSELQSIELDESIELAESQSSPEDLTEPLSVELDELEMSFRAPPSRRVEGQSETEVDDNREPDALDIDPVTVQAERRSRISKAQDEELKWADIKAYLRGQIDELTRRRVHNAGKIADYFVLSEDGLLYYLGQRRPKSGLDEDDLKLRLVAPTTMIDEVLQSCHDSLEGGHQGIVRTYHRVKADYYWVGLYADVIKYVQACEDCSTSKSKPQLRGYSPGNVVSERPFHIVSLDFVIPLPQTRRGNTALLLFQDHFSGFVIAKAMRETGTLEVAKAFEECIFRRFGAPSLIRHDRDPRFMSEVFQTFSEMMQSRSRATLSYRPQANGQQERSVKTMIQTVRVYVEDPLQADWDDIAEKLVYAVNNSRDSTRRETPFYLVHGWDAQSTLKAMTSSIRRASNNSSSPVNAVEWRRESNRQREVALKLAKQYQLAEKARRAQIHNESLSGKEKKTIPNPAGRCRREGTNETNSASAEADLVDPGTNPTSFIVDSASLCDSSNESMSQQVNSASQIHMMDIAQSTGQVEAVAFENSASQMYSASTVTPTNRAFSANSRTHSTGNDITDKRDSASVETEFVERNRSLFKEGDQVWLFMERVKPGLVKKLAHRWHGPFRIKRKVEEFAYELELPDRSGYRFYPVVHVSRLKAVVGLGDRPTTPLVDGLGEEDRFDFDEELLPEDSWEPDEESGKYEVEAILDDKWSNSTSTERTQRMFKVKWAGYDEPTWEPLCNLSCGGLLFDYLQRKRRENRLQMVQVADED